MRKCCYRLPSIAKSEKRNSDLYRYNPTELDAKQTFYSYLRPKNLS